MEMEETVSYRNEKRAEVYGILILIDLGLVLQNKAPNDTVCPRWCNYKQSYIRLKNGDFTESHLIKSVNR